MRLVKHLQLSQKWRFQGSSIVKAKDFPALMEMKQGSFLSRDRISNYPLRPDYVSVTQYLVIAAVTEILRVVNLLKEKFIF